MAKHVNKVVYNGETLIDLTADTIDPSKLLVGTTAHDASGAIIDGACTWDADTKDATAVGADILSGKTAYVNGQKVEGAMANNGAVDEKISTKDGSYVVPQGYHNGEGKVAIAEEAVADLLPENLAKGKNVLGVEGANTMANFDTEFTVSEDGKTMTVSGDLSSKGVETLVVGDDVTVSIEDGCDITIDAESTVTVAGQDVTINVVEGGSVIAENLEAANIAKGKTILGVEGSNVMANYDGDFVVDEAANEILVKTNSQDLQKNFVIDAEGQSNVIVRNGDAHLSVEGAGSVVAAGLEANNIRKGTTVLGVEGTLETVIIDGESRIALEGEYDAETITLTERPADGHLDLRPFINDYNQVVLDVQLDFETIAEGDFEEITVTPKATEQVLMASEGYDAIGKVTVAPIPFVREENEFGGDTVIIG